MKKLFSMKEKGMRLLAALLCLSMVVGMIPQFDVRSIAAGKDDILLDFRIYGSLPDRRGAARTIRMMTDATFAMGGWEFCKELTDTSGYTNITNLQASSMAYYQYRVDANGTNMRFVDGWWSSNDNKVIAFKFNATTAGEYDLKGTFSTILYEYGVDFQVLVENGEGNRVSVGSLGSDAPMGTAIDFDRVTLTEGINYLIFKGNPGSAQSIITLDNFVFTKVGGSQGGNTDKPDEPDYLTPTGKEKTLNFKIYNSLPDRQGTDRSVRIITDATFSMGGWQFSKELSDKNLYTNITNLQAGSRIWYLYRVDATGTNLRFADGWWSSDNNKVAAFEFKADSTGYYDVRGVFSSILYDYGVDLEVFVEDGNGNRTSIGKVDANTPANSTIDFDRAYLTEGVNYLIFKGAPGSTQSIITLDKFVFAELQEPKNEAMIVPESSAALAGETVGFKAWLNLKDGSMLEADGMTGDDSITVTTTDSSVAVIENGRIKAVGEGDCEIKVTVVYGGEAYEKSTAFSVVSVPEGEFKLVADAAWGIKPGRKAQVLVQGAYSNVVVNMENAKDIEVRTSNNNATAATVFKNGNLYVEVKGVSEGNCDVTLTASYNGKPASVVIPVDINKDAVGGAPFSLDLTSCTWENLQILTHGIGVNKDLTAADIMFRQGWVVYIGSSAKVELKKDESVFYDINVPADGEYIFSMNVIHNVIGFVAALYIDGEFIGEHDFSDMGENPPENRDTSIDASCVLRNIKLTKGTHVLEFKRVSDAGYFMWMKTFTFTPVAASPTVVGVGMTSNKNTFTPGESVKNKFSVRLSDGRDFAIPALVPDQGSFAVENRMPERMDYTNGVMKAKKTGMSFFEFDVDVPVDGGKFTAAWTGTVSEGQLADFTVAEGDKTPEFSGVYENGWAVNKDKTTITTEGTGYKLKESGFNAVFGAEEVLAIDTFVQNSGIFNIDAAVTKIDDGCLADVYIGEKYLGRIDFAKDSGNVQLNTVELTTGVDTVYIKKVGGGSKIALKQLSFVRVENMPTYSHVTVENETSDIALNKTLQAKVKVMLNDGRVYHIGPKLDGSVDNDNKIEYSAEPTGIFSVNPSTGLMKGEQVGDATLKAKVFVKGVNVANVEKLFSVVHVLKVIPQYESIKVLRTETAAVELSATMDDAPIDITGASEINPIPADFRTEGYVEVKDGKATLYIKGLRGGETAMDVEAVVNGVVGRVSIPVTVSIPTNNDDQIFLDFSPNNSNRPSSPNDADINKHSWAVNTEQTSPNAFKSPNYKLGVYGLQTQLKDGEQFAFDIWVGMSGNYQVEMVGTSIGPSGICAGLYVDGVYLGEFQFAHPTSKSDDDIIPNQTKQLNSISLGAGKHTFVIKKLEKSRPHAYDQAFWLGSLKFSSIDVDLAFDYVDAKVGKNLLCVGESTAFDANIYMTDGNIRYIDEDDTDSGITITNSNPAVAQLRDGRIYALSEGTATFSVSGKVDGEEKVAFVDIEVDGAMLDGVEAVLGGDLSVGQSAYLNVKALAGEREISLDSVEFTVEPYDSSIVSASGTKLTGVKAGTSDVTVTAKLGGVTVSTTVEVTVVEDGIGSFKVECASKIRPNTTTQIDVIGGSFLGNPIDITDAEITYQTNDTSIISVDENGCVTGLAVGDATIKVTVKKGLFEGEEEIKITVTNGKVGRSYYTDDKVANALENASLYTWAKNEQKNAIKNAEFYIGKEDLLWNMVTTHALPRSSRIGLRYDPNAHRCRYCDTDLTEYGDITYAWKFDAFNATYKIQCPACRRRFPTNDFGSFYALGIDENGEWSYEKSHRDHYFLFEADYAAKGVTSYEQYQQMRASGARLPGVGYLENKSMLEVGSLATVNNSRGLKGDERVDAWGVDDGFGYKPGYSYATPSFGDFEEAHTYIAYYNRFVFASTFNTALANLSKAYMYTNDIRYARSGAVLLDRIADIYPTMYWSEHFPEFPASDGSYPKGRIEGRIWETSTVKWYAHAYDAFYPAFDDPQVVSYLSGKAAKYNMANSKKTGDDIRKNIEDGVLREIFKACVDGDIHGNFGMHQQRIADVGVILDSMPESKEILDYLMAKDTAWVNDYNHTGGDVMDNLINGVDRDGGSAEGISPNYSMIWYNCISDIASVINGYKGYEAADLFKHPKVQKMLENLTHFVQVRNTTAAIGDSGITAGIELNIPSTSSLMKGFRATNNVLLAQTLYFLNGNKTEGIHEDIFTKNPEGIQDDIKAIIDEHGEYPFDASLMTAEQGYAILRDGSLYGEGEADELDTQRDFWMNFGFYGIHSHADMLNMGIHAFGLDFAPDLGYPTQADGGDEYVNWGHATVNHNTVVVDDSKQLSPKVEGFPMHFDDAGRVKVMDVDGSVAYSQTDIYRRTVVMVEASDDISYGVDFFRVRGGTEHLYSFHAQSNTVSGTSGNFTLEEQFNGTYAGENVPYRTPGVTSGYSYFTNVRKAEKPGVKDFYVDYLIQDFRNLKPNNNQGLHMRFTMLNDFEADEISLVKGETPVRGNNPRWLEYMLVRHSSPDGKPLDTTFTTVLEPYNENDKYIQKTEQVGVVVDDESRGAVTSEDVVRAIKVTLASGREDYIIYASNNNVKYIVDGKISFRGFTGVCSYIGNDVVYSYVCDGDEITDISSKLGVSMKKEFTGEVVDFTRDLVFDNFINVKIDGNPSVEELKKEIVGRWMYVENNINKKSGNAAYLIQDVTAGATAGTYDIALGNTTLIRSGTNVTLEDGDYTYNIAPRQWFNIPMSGVMSAEPVFTNGKPNETAVPGMKYSQTISAESPSGKDIVYSAVSLPRGAFINPQTGVVTWVPDKTQIGEHHFAVMASDGLLESTRHFTVNVHKSVGGGSIGESTGDGSSGGNSGAGGVTGGEQGGSASGGNGGGAGGGAGGGGASGGNAENPSENDKPSDKPESGEEGGTTGGDVAEGEQFTDLGNHSWAKEAIYALVEKGVVKGTSGNTYSPANNIKRADFAIMLTRAFGITEGDAEQFADVDAAKYYAEELRLAKSAGIVAGIGENKFNPEGEISRQDMMVMLYRALKAQNYELSEPDHSVLADFADAALIADYAKDAVSVLVKDEIIGGSNGRISPLAKANRAEIAVMLSRAIKTDDK